MNKNYWEIGAGILTFEDVSPSIISKLLYRYKWGIEYLPAGNTLGMPEIKDMPLEDYEEIISIISEERKVVINTLQT